MRRPRSGSPDTSPRPILTLAAPPSCSTTRSVRSTTSGAAAVARAAGRVRRRAPGDRLHPRPRVRRRPECRSRPQGRPLHGALRSAAAAIRTPGVSGRLPTPGRPRTSTAPARGADPSAGANQTGAHRLGRRVRGGVRRLGRGLWNLGAIVHLESPRWRGRHLRGPAEDVAKLSRGSPTKTIASSRRATAGFRRGSGATTRAPRELRRPRADRARAGIDNRYKPGSTA